MFKRIARIALQAEVAVNSGRFPKIPENSLSRYVIPFVKLPEWDNTAVIDKFVEDTKKEIKAGPKEYIDIEKASLELSKIINGPKRLTGIIDIQDGKMCGRTIDHVGLFTKIGADLSTYIYVSFSVMEHAPDFMIGVWFMGVMFVVIRPINASVCISTTNIHEMLDKFREQKASKAIADELSQK